jgi:uncharacterized protein (DUF4415 family)
MTDMNFSARDLASLRAASEQQAAMMAALRAAADAKMEADLAALKASYEAMTPDEQAAYDEAQKPKPPILVRTPADVTDEMIRTTDSLAREDDRGNIDWEWTIDNIDRWRGEDGAEWDFGDLPTDDPVFEKIKRGVRNLRREGDQ